MTRPGARVRLMDARASLARSRAERDAAVVAAAEAAVPTAEIARLVGLSRMQVHRILKRTKEPQ